MKRKDNYNRSLLHFASFGGNINIIRKVIEMKFDLDICDKEGLTSCHYESIAGNLEALKLLIANGVNIFTFNNYYMTNCDYACLFGHLSIVKYLNEITKIDFDFGINKINSNCEYSPLSYVCQRDDVNIVEYMHSKVNQSQNQIMLDDSNAFYPFICSIRNASIQ